MRNLSSYTAILFPCPLLYPSQQEKQWTLETADYTHVRLERHTEIFVTVVFRIIKFFVQISMFCFFSVLYVSIMLNSLRLQVAPVVPAGQIHTAPVAVAWQVPRTQGLGLQISKGATRLDKIRAHLDPFYLKFYTGSKCILTQLRVY